jgi:hypothetical protein
MIIIPVPGIVLWAIFVCGAAVALVSGLIYRFRSRSKRSENVMLGGIAIAGIGGLGLLVGYLTG